MRGSLPGRRPAPRAAPGTTSPLWGPGLQSVIQDPRLRARGGRGLVLGGAPAFARAAPVTVSFPSLGKGRQLVPTPTARTSPPRPGPAGPLRARPPLPPNSRGRSPVSDTTSRGRGPDPSSTWAVVGAVCLTAVPPSVKSGWRRLLPGSCQNEVAHCSQHLGQHLTTRRTRCQLLCQHGDAPSPGTARPQEGPLHVCRTALIREASSAGPR